MNKKAFTLAEILGVIVIIGLLSVIITPLVVNRLKGNSDVVSSANNDLIFASTDDYINENIENYPPGKNYCIQVQELIDSGHLSEKTKDIITGDSLNTYYVSANIYGVGNVDYNLYKTKNECENVKSLPTITFTVNNGWNQTKDVIINYPRVNNTTYPEKGSNWKYKTDSGNWIELNESQAYNNINNKINVTRDGTVIYAEMKYGDRVIKNKIKIDMISTDKPTIELADYKTSDDLNIKTNCSDNNNITMTFTSKGGTKIDKYAVTLDESDPSQWIDIENNNKVSVKYPVEVANDKKVHYIHVVDTAGNREKISFTPNIVHTINYDVNNPDNTNNIIINTTSKQIINGQTYSSPQPSKVGYTFNGWFKDKTYSQKVNDSDMVCLNNDQTLYAKWTLAYTKPSCTLSLSGTKGNVADNKQWFRSNVTITMSTSTGLGKPTSYGIDTTPYQTNGRVSATQSNDTQGTTFYGYVSNPAGSSTCQITVYKDVTAPTYSELSGGGNNWSSGNITVTNKGTDSTSGISTWQYITTPQLQTNAHVENIGWLGLSGKGSNGGTNINGVSYLYGFQGASGVTGTIHIGRRLEAYAIKIINSSISGGVSYSENGSSVVSNGATSGATGASHQIKYVKASLTGNLASYYDITYRTHRSDVGWKDNEWVSNGTNTKNDGHIVQALDIKLTQKSGTSLPWTNANNSSQTYTYTFTAEQDTLNYFRLCDKAGNCSGSRSVKIRIDKTRPLGVIYQVNHNGTSIDGKTINGVTKNTCFYKMSLNGQNVSCELKFGTGTYSMPEFYIDNLSGMQEQENKFTHNGTGSCKFPSWTKNSKICWSAPGATVRNLYSRAADNAGNYTGEIKATVTTS